MIIINTREDIQLIGLHVSAISMISSHKRHTENNTLLYDFLVRTSQHLICSVNIKKTQILLHAAKIGIKFYERSCKH